MAASLGSKRKGHYLAGNNARNAGEELIRRFNSGEAVSIVELDQIRYRIRTQQDKFATLSEAIQREMADEERREQDVTSSTEADIQFSTTIDDLMGIRNQLVLNTSMSDSVGGNSTAVSGSSPGTSGSNRIAPVSLPALELPSFDGDVKKWQSFWETFQATVDKDDQLADVVKFGYLVSKLQGKAKRSIEGLQVTNENYSRAVSILQAEYADPTEIKRQHHSGLMSLPRASSSAVALRHTLNTISSHIRSLQALGEKVDSDFVVTTIIDKFPMEVQQFIEDSRDRNTSITVDKLLELLSGHIASRERVERRFGSDSQNTSVQHSAPSTTEALLTTRPPTSQGNTARSGFGNRQGPRMNQGFRTDRLAGRPNQTEQRGPLKCLFCDRADHRATQCTMVVRIEERKEKLRAANRCFACIKIGHIARQCRSFKRCSICGVGRHNQVICERNPTLKPVVAVVTQIEPAVAVSPPTSNLVEPSSSTMPQLTVSRGTERMRRSTVLKTVLLTVFNIETGASVTVRAVLDTGGCESYMSERLRKMLGLSIRSPQRLTFGTFGTDAVSSVNSGLVLVRVEGRNGHREQMEFHVVPTITKTVVRAFVDLEQHGPIINTIQLADTMPRRSETTTFDLLIANNYYDELILPQVINLAPKLHLINSKFGWVLSGVADNPEDQTMNVTLVSASNTVSGIVETLWDVESIGIKDCPMEDDDDVVRKLFKESVAFENGRYNVSFPWKDSPERSRLEDNLELCKKRLDRLVERKLKPNPQLFSKYCEILEEQERDGIIEKVGFDQRDGPRVHYLPHRAHETEASKTTKVRIVYDGSASRGAGFPSLNECLYRGPIILASLAGCLLRSRLRPIQIIADVKKAFLQLSLHMKDRDAVRFLWLKDRNKPACGENLQAFRFARVPFGLICSPSLLGMVIEHHLELDGSSVAKEIAQDLYVDNVATGVNKLAEAKHFYTQSKELFNQMNMDLRAFASNSSDFLKMIPEVDRCEDEVVKILGLQWNTVEDTYSLSTSKLAFPAKPTAKDVLSCVASVAFDPIGLVTPCTVQAKVFLKKLCSAKVTWNQSLPHDLLKEWLEILVDLQKLRSVQLPRYSGITEHSTDFQLHMFCDASGQAYATVAYLRWTVGNRHDTFFLFSKNRLVPKTPCSLPRKELLSSFIGAKVAKFVRSELKLDIQKTYMWLDAQIVLAWIRSTKSLSKFVENRVREIRKVENCEFRYVDTKDNPADLPTRGIGVGELMRSDLWFKGPSWLRRDDSEWPIFDNHKLTPEQLKLIESESRHRSSDVSAVLVGLGFEVHGSLIDVTRFSNLRRLEHAMAYVLRFRDMLCKKLKFGKVVSMGELESARKVLDIQCQEEHFEGLRIALGEGTKHRLIEQLGVYADRNGILRCKGRLQNLPDSDEARFPKLIPSGPHYAKLVVEDCHRRLYHAGLSQTLAEVRKEYWIPKGRKFVNSVIKKCKVCKRHSGGPYQLPKMAPLPEQRLAVHSDPFTYAGIDFFGPMYVRSSVDTVKVYGVIYVCAVTRAVHLDLVDDMTTGAFLLSFRRFVARRGVPVQVVSDNAPQLVLTDSILTQVFDEVVRSEDVQAYAATRRICWKFIPAYAPWHGGFYERLVRSVKDTLKKAIGRLALTRIQLETVLIETEAIVNSRPLTYIDEDINSSAVLSPQSFLGSRRTSVPVFSDAEELADEDWRDKVSSKDSLLLNWRKGVAHLDRMWKIWLGEYARALRETQRLSHLKVKGEAGHPAAGHVVMVHEDAPRGRWKLGRVIRVFQGKDGAERVAEVKMSNGNTFTRSIRHLYPLETDVNCVPVEEKGPETTHPGQLDEGPTRYNLRPRLTKAN